jgi:Fe-S cluster biogenesis protein NfuA
MTDTEIQQKIEKALEEIRPFLINDGGDISLVAIEENIVKVKFLGACINCNINKMTLKNGIEETIKRYVPHITSVIAVS